MGVGKAPFFNFYFEVFAYTIAGVCAIQCLIAFLHRCVTKKAAPINVTGLVASCLTLVYTIVGLTYYFEGLSNLSFGCTTLVVINGGCMSSSNAIIFLHLFLKAEAANKSNKAWRYYRVIGILSTLWMWATVIAVHVLIDGYEVPTPDGGRCRYKFNDTSFNQKWIAQLINQVIQTTFFIYPLISHMRSSGMTFKASSNDLYTQLVVRAILSCTFAVLFTAAITGVVFYGRNHPALLVPGFGLAVLDNAVNLGGIYFAINVDTAVRKELPVIASGQQAPAGSVKKFADYATDTNPTNSTNNTNTTASSKQGRNTNTTASSSSGGGERGRGGTSAVSHISHADVNLDVVDVEAASAPAAAPAV